MHDRHLRSDEIELLLDGEEGFGVAPLRAHVKSCTSCRQELESARELMVALDSLPDFAPSVNFSDRVMSQVQVFEPWHAAATRTVEQFVPATRPARIDSVLNAAVPRDIIAPTELSRITDDGQVDVIDSVTSTLMRESIGGFMFRRELPLLRGGSGKLCTLFPATLLHVRALGPRRVLEAFTLTANPKDDALVGRHLLTVAPSSRLRWGNGDSRRCLLLTDREVLIVSAPADPSAGVSPQLTTLRAPGDSGPPPTIERRGDAADSARLRQPFIVDAAIVDGGFVVLVGLESDSQGRVLDYYDERGRYIQSAMLPFTASAMSGAGPRFLALHQDERYRWWLSSWLTPMAAHGATAPPEPRQLDDAPERQLFARPTRARRP